MKRVVFLLSALATAVLSGGAVYKIG